MLPGKVYKPEDFLQLLRRRIWLLLVPFAVVSAITAVVAKLLPDQYRSETLILVVPQRVPETYVKSTVTAKIEDRLTSITQQILSRTRLERIIQDFNLYEEERKTGIMEDVVEKMRRDIDTRVIQGDAFRVSYVGKDPRTVMRVTERLASLFIEENLRDREVLAEGTNQFLESQLDDARRRLIEQEQKLEAYRRQYSGQLPSQLESNLQVVQNTQMQIQSIVESLNRDGDRRLILERQIADLEQAPLDFEPSQASAASTGNGDAPTASSATAQLAQARASLAALQQRLRPEHPDVLRMQRLIRDLEPKAAKEAAEAAAMAATPLSPTVVPGRSPAAVARQRRLNDLQIELDSLKRQMANKQTEEQRLRDVVSSYQARAEAAPTRESEMAELTRDYTTLQTMYASLLAKKEESKIAANLERRQIGEQFKLLDPARMAEKPFSPNRQRINLMGMFAGLAIGVALVALLEFKDKSFKTDEEVLSVLSLPVLAVVPFMQSAAERQRLFRQRLVLNLGLGSTVVGCLAVLVYTFLTIR
jgi:polysaccharide chain length determinant protein (PEP-CTERM system associated)